MLNQIIYKLVIEGILIGHGLYIDLLPEYRKLIEKYESVTFERVNDEDLFC